MYISLFIFFISLHKLHYGVCPFERLFVCFVQKTQKHRQTKINVNVSYRAHATSIRIQSSPEDVRLNVKVIRR